MKDKIKYLLLNLITTFKFMKYHKKDKKYPNSIAADLIRNTHSIEKGLSISDVRLGFGHAKLLKMMTMIEQIEKYESPYYKEVITMAVSAINSYIMFHEDKNYNDDFLAKIKSFVEEHNDEVKENYGGTIELNTDELKFNIPEIEKFINSRHSIRMFSSKPVDNSIIKKAIKLAQQAPSACNRQGVRVYVIDKEKAKFITNQLEGIGGFAKSIDKLILITGKLSAYGYNEINQFIVSASIYAGYLSLALHLYGLGACVIQRPVIWTKKWNAMKKEYNISDDEQIVCMLGVGNIEGKINVPISHRIDIDEFSKFI